MLRAVNSSFNSLCVRRLLFLVMERWWCLDIVLYYGSVWLLYLSCRCVCVSCLPVGWLFLDWYCIMFGPRVSVSRLYFDSRFMVASWLLKGVCVFPVAWNIMLLICCSSSL